jgi:uncharacterized protein (DUF302 family)
MKYFVAKQLNKNYDETRQIIEQKLKNYGFGIVSEIDIHEKFREKLGVDFRRYKILGACSPKHAYEAISNEEHIGLMLPCNVVMQEKGKNLVEVSVIDPAASMQAVENKSLEGTATEIRDKLVEFIESL